MKVALLAIIAAFSAFAFMMGIALDLSWLKIVSKPWPVLAMAAWVWPLGDRRIAHGLLAGAVGDICLSFPSAFLPGMIAFAIGHGLYVRAFFDWHKNPALLLLVPVAAYLILGITLMLPGTGPLTIPVIAYMGIIGAMLWRAAALAADDLTHGFMRWCPLAGALLFGFSDTLIGLNKFATPLPGAAFPIILSYWTGQFLIATSGQHRMRQPS